MFDSVQFAAVASGLATFTVTVEIVEFRDVVLIVTPNGVPCVPVAGLTD